MIERSKCSKQKLYLKFREKKKKDFNKKIKKKKKISKKSRIKGRAKQNSKTENI